MKLRFGAIAAAALLAAIPASAQDIGDIQAGAESLVDTLATALPFNSAIGLNWSDAYIGQLLGVPPRFGVGVAVGATTVEAAGFSDLLGNFGVELDLPGSLGDSLPLPAAVAEARIGGFLLPFDIGVKAGYIPESTSESLSDIAGGLKVDYLLVGADLRYALIKGGLLLPRLSVGVGFNYMKGGVGKKVGSDQVFNYDASAYPGYGNYTITATAPDVGINWESTVIDLKAQLSKSLLIFTPYIGAGVSYGKTTAGYSIDSEVTYEDENGPVLPQEIKDALAAGGISVPELSSTGFSYSKEVSGWAFRAFGGLSVNLLVLRLDVSALYNFADGALGGSLGLRFQL